MSYNHAQWEPKWQKFWKENKTFRSEIDPAKPKFYILDMFPYPSSTGLHVGHPEGYTASDIVSRYKRAKGFNVLHPMGWDAFGLPAEQYAIKTGTHPEKTTNAAIANFKKQLSSLGFSFDWDREISTCDPKYYRWTQWIFKRLYEKGLVYSTEIAVNWCPELKTVLANEEVVDGRSERGGHPVFRVPMKQWMLKITDYAERLLKDLDGLDWPESTKELQRNWIGKSEGLRLHFPVRVDAEDHSAEDIEVFTTRADTLLGVSAVVLAPEHPVLKKISTWIPVAHRMEVQSYIIEASKKSEIARQDQSKEKTGVFTGRFVTHPLSGKSIPIWISDYVLATYGTGAVMSVPAHDERDFAFAKKFGLPILPVIKASGAESSNSVDAAFTDEGVCFNSGNLIDGKSTADARRILGEWAEKSNKGKRLTQYKLRDWLFSRQRYWGEPFPVLRNSKAEISLVADQDLPVTLPVVTQYEPSGTGESPLASIQGWVEVRDAAGNISYRETDTMPGSAGSSWYFLRFCDPRNDQSPWSKEAEKYWMPVDLYVGGPEHAVGHLLYARFWTKVLHDLGLVTHSEPFQKLVHQGMILGEDGEKMSKSRGNVINPDIIVEKFGADTLRIYEMFMGPLSQDKPWSTAAIEGTYRFLNRVYRLFVEEASPGHEEKWVVEDTEPQEEDWRILHQTIQKVTEDIEHLRFNTAVSQMMIFTNHFTKSHKRPRKCLEPFIQLLQPFAPHFAEEIWERLGRRDSLSFAKWPEFDAKWTVKQTWTIAVQVLGKMKGTVEIPVGSDQATAEAAARELLSVKNALADKTPKKVIFVPGKILNFVV